MARQVATKRLAVFHSTQAGLTVQIYVCSPGTRAILKSTLVSNRAAAAANLDLWLSGQGANPFFLRIPLAGLQNVEQSSWIVLEEGDAIYANADQPEVEAWLSGSVLTLPS